LRILGFRSCAPEPVAYAQGNGLRVVRNGLQGPSTLPRPPHRRGILPGKIHQCPGQRVAPSETRAQRAPLTVIFARRQDGWREEDGRSALAGAGTRRYGLHRQRTGAGIPHAPVGECWIMLAAARVARHRCRHRSIRVGQSRRCRVYVIA